MRACEACGREFEAKNRRHRFCSTACRSRGRDGATVVPLGTDSAPDSLEDVTRRQLAEVGRESSPEGVNALLLARRLDHGGDTGSAIAALSRQHMAALEAALDDVPPAGDKVDELRKRREQRLSG